MFSAKKLCMRCDVWAGMLWWSCQSPVAHSWGLLNHPNSYHRECSSLMQNWMKIRCSTCSVILNVTVTQYTCSLNGIYCPHWLVQWSCHFSHLCIPVHSLWLPGYMDVLQTILVILTMAGLFLNRPCFMCVCVYLYTHMFICIHLYKHIHTLYITHTHIYIYL